jgi:hypothetical protein
MGAASSPLSPAPQKHFLVVAQDVAGVMLSEKVHDLVRKAELVHGVSGAHQLVDGPHALQSDGQRLVVAVNVSDDADSHVSRV